MNVTASQEGFQTCYRGTQGVLRHAAYMRMSKVLLIQHLLAELKVDLAQKSVFDYGFGAGTFFRYCPPSSRLFGVELDPVTVEEVAQTLVARGREAVCLQPIRIENWQEHPLLRRKYDLILCSHVIEHLENPAAFLKRMGECLESDGILVGLVPINERQKDPHHAQQLTRAGFQELVPATELKLVRWMETDAWLYWLQPIFTYERGFGHRLAQAISLGLGIVAMAAGPHWWFRWSSLFARLSASQPTQAAFVLRR